MGIPLGIASSRKYVYMYKELAITTASLKYMNDSRNEDVCHEDSECTAPLTSHYETKL